MKASQVLKIILVFFLLMLLGMFIFENIDPVPIWIPFFKGRRFGLIFIIVLFYILGALSAVWVMSRIGANMKKKMKLRELSEEDEELFEDEA
ncbi:MAG: hypothetical protein HQL26_10460 [Candidatus Omnitrophica bacterium]|nr:hypothetical protein [Candidatus Omnitrophota bacterium]